MTGITDCVNMVWYVTFHWRVHSGGQNLWDTTKHTDILNHVNLTDYYEAHLYNRPFRYKRKNV